MSPRLEKRIERSTDRVHVYTLCESCTPKIRTVGSDLPVAREFDVW